MTNRELIRLAKSAYQNSYSPYSKTKVGAALLTSNGEVYTGCNIENASYGLSMCAERVAVYNAISSGKKEFTKIGIASNQKREFSPCGACRQVLAEFGAGIEAIWQNNRGEIKSAKLTELLPKLFKK